MTNSKLLHVALLGCCVLALGACEDDEDNNVTVQQVDRMGRPGINTAITDPFYRTSEASEQARHDANASDYNGNDDPASWNSQFNAAFQNTLAVLDSLDDGNCQNQLLDNSANDSTIDRYELLASVLTDDRLYVDTSFGNCRQYLAVEANRVGLTAEDLDIDDPNIVLASDCGGRTPLYDVIDTTYSALSVGKFVGVGDGVDFDASSTPSATVFPFLNSPIIVEVIENELTDSDSSDGGTAAPASDDS